MNIFPTQAVIQEALGVTATGFTRCPSYSCRALEIVAPPDSTVLYQRGRAASGNDGPAIVIAAGTSRLVVGINNADEVWVKRGTGTGGVVYEVMA